MRSHQARDFLGNTTLILSFVATTVGCCSLEADSVRNTIRGFVSATLDADVRDVSPYLLPEALAITTTKRDDTTVELLSRTIQSFFDESPVATPSNSIPRCQLVGVEVSIHGSIALATATVTALHPDDREQPKSETRSHYLLRHLDDTWYVVVAYSD